MLQKHTTKMSNIYLFLDSLRGRFARPHFHAFRSDFGINFGGLGKPKAPKMEPTNQAKKIPKNNTVLVRFEARMP